MRKREEELKTKPNEVSRENETFETNSCIPPENIIERLIFMHLTRIEYH